MIPDFLRPIMSRNTLGLPNRREEERNRDKVYAKRERKNVSCQFGKCTEVFWLFRNSPPGIRNIFERNQIRHACSCSYCSTTMKTEDAPVIHQ